MSERIRGVSERGTYISGLGPRGSTSTLRIQLRLLPWRREGGPLMGTPLVLECDAPNMQVAYEVIGTRFAGLNAALLVRCNVVEEDETGARGELIAIEDPGRDEARWKDREIRRAWDVLRRSSARGDARRKAAPPAAIEIASRPLDGKVRLDPERGKLIANRGPIEIVIARTERTAEEDVRAAEPLVAALLPRLPTLALGVAGKLLDLYNDEWRSADDPVESAASFATRIQLEGLDIAANGELSLWYHDDDLFTGHGIRVAIGPEGVMSADLVSSRTSAVPATPPAADIVRGAVVRREWCQRDSEGRGFFRCQLSPWRRGEGAIHKKPLHVVRGVENARTAQDSPELYRLHARAVVAIRCRVAVDRMGSASAELLSVEKAVPDAELATAVDASRAPVAASSPTLGDFVATVALDELIAHRGDIEIRIERKGRPNRKAVRDAEAVMAVLDPRLPTFALGVAERLVGVYNDEWRPEGAPVETAASLAKRMAIEVVYLGAAYTEVHYLDDGLFAGRRIIGRVGADGIEDARLER